jgi:hypothetical protein
MIFRRLREIAIGLELFQLGIMISQKKKVK